MIDSPEVEDYSHEEYQMREQMRESTRLYDTSNQLENGAFNSPVETLKWLFGFKK